MDATFFQTIFKRKSFHLFRGIGTEQLSEDEIEDIKRAYTSFESLYSDIHTEIRIVPAKQVNLTPDAEYCILLYSEKKENYLMNAGYLGEQLDLYLVSHNIGSLWCGIGRADEKIYHGLEYVIMIAIRKVNDEKLFRKDMFKAKRKPLEDIWTGETFGVGEIARFAPSACNSQPWFVKKDCNTLSVYRIKKSGRVGIMPEKMAAYFNRIDIGIFLCILEICLAEKSMHFTRETFSDLSEAEDGKILAAVYNIQSKGE